MPHAEVSGPFTYYLRALNAIQSKRAVRSTLGGAAVELSARNQLKGQVVRVKSGAVMAEVEVKIKAGRVVAAITEGSLKRMKLKAGDKVTVIIKATEVLIGK
jgi:molybdopterin-binding protein